MSSKVVLRSLLIVDDSPVERECLRALLLKAWPKVHLLEAINGAEALDAVSRHLPDVVLTELRAPNLSGLDLTSTLKKAHPELPILLVTKLGDAETAVAAQHRGGDGYVPKSCIQQWLIPTIELVCEKAENRRKDLEAISCVTEQELQFTIPNDMRSASALVTYLQEQIEAMQLLERNELTRVGIALHEALSNAIYHGNLELTPELREEDNNLDYDLADIRRSQWPYCDRRVHVHVILDSHFVRFVIRDEGLGFDVAEFQEPTETDDENLVQNHGFGMLLISDFMDSVRHNHLGNEITLTKYSSPAAPLLSEHELFTRRGVQEESSFVPDSRPLLVEV